MLTIGMTSWFTALASKIDMKKTSYNRWMKQFKSEEEQEQVNKQDLEEGKQLHDLLMRSRKPKDK
jgi:hypothetical protein